jgi:hypothetical protein
VKRLVALALAALVGSLTIGVASAVPAAALDSSDIRLSALSVNQGSPLGVQIDYLYESSSCKVWMEGPKRSAVKSVPIKRYKVRTTLSTAGLPTGTYVVRANCGKSGKATSGRVGIIPKGAPTTATCDVAEKGFSAAADGETSFGAVISNRSPVLAASGVQLAIAFLDGAGNTLATKSSYVMAIRPGESVYDGGTESVTGVAAIRIDAVCESTTEVPESRLRGQAQYIRPRDSDYYPSEFGGSFTNTLPFIIASFSEVNFVTRNAAGQITGGGSDYLDAFVPVGATGTWGDISSIYPSNISSVDWILDAEKQ